MPGETPSHDITQLLHTAEQPGPAAELLALVYEQLRSIAQLRMAGERRNHTLQATALVHEAYLRLLGNAEVEWKNRGHFFAAAAEAMRRILIERARSKAGPRRGGRRVQLDLNELELADEEKSQELLLLDDALGQLERHDAQAASLVKLRFFAGLAHQEAAAALGISRGAADRLWTVARAWLLQRIRD